jgi:hypothetical protein
MDVSEAENDRGVIMLSALQRFEDRRVNSSRIMTAGICQFTTLPDLNSAEMEDFQHTSGGDTLL